MQKIHRKPEEKRLADKRKFYVVWQGHNTGIFESWDETKAQVDGFPGAQYKSFNSRADAERALHESYRDYLNTKPADRITQWRLMGVDAPLLDSYCVDAACSGNSGVLEYRCVRTDTGAEIFARGPFQEGTNNIGEFLAIVETLMLLAKNKSDTPIYSDSRIAIRWVKLKKCLTQLVRTRRNAPLFERIERAEHWLSRIKYSNPVLKWDTAVWGENPADYGRK